MPEWEEILGVLADSVAEIEVRTINGTAKDALNYVEHERTGLKVIAVGGDKLSRGLTLEGLSVSYFLRASRMYDTLMQMGRWFGYRPGYLDLCRLYIPPELVEWFGSITDAAEELREEFDLMAASGATPRDYGLKVQAHPVLMVTSCLKMRTARNLMLSFSGQLLETISLHSESHFLQRNVEATSRFLSPLGKPLENGLIVRQRGNSRQEWKGFLWSDVPGDEVATFLTGYSTHPEAHKVRSLLLADFIRSMCNIGELTRWVVAVIGGGEGKAFELTDGISVEMLRRANKRPNEGRYSIGRLLSPRDEAIDLDEVSWLAALAATKEAWHADPGRRQMDLEPEVPNGPAIRKIRGFGASGVAAHPERGVLLLYALDPNGEWTGLPDGSPPAIAFGISFPGSYSGVKVEYKVNNIGWELEYGSSE